jgi:hypothetical protein
MFRLIRLAVAGGAAACTLLASPAGAIPCPPGTHPVVVCTPAGCTVVCVPNIPAAGR